ncbi:MAG: hypothetical protein GY861_23065 [bacterium]|nr:hypothetical protein [bacterium]
MDNTTSKLILGFVALLLGAILASQVAVQANVVTEKSRVSDEAIDISVARLAGGDINETYPFTVTYAPSGWKMEECPLTAVTYGNSTDDYTVTTDYVMTASTGVLTLLNTTEVYQGTNDTLVDYTYCGDDYTNLAWGRTAIQVAIGLFALGVFLLAVGLFYSVAKDTGLVGK